MAKITKWRGKQVAQAVAKNIGAAMGEFGLRVEGNSKRQLQKGHGVLTGTLRRSIHTELPGYNWHGDDVDPGSGSAELGGQAVVGENKSGKVTVQVGSGLVYALAIHQGWSLGYKNTRGSFAGYHFITNGLAQAKPDLPKIIRKHALKK